MRGGVAIAWHGVRLLHHRLPPPRTFHDRPAGLEAAEVQRATNALVMEGTIYTTCDDSHFRVT